MRNSGKIFTRLPPITPQKPEHSGMDRCVRILLGKSINDTATSDQVRLRLDARPISMSVRMASDRDTRSPPHLSIAAIVAAGTRNAITGSFAVVGRRSRFETVDAPPRRVIFSTTTGLMRARLKVWRGSIGPILDFPLERLQSRNQPLKRLGFMWV